MLGDAPGLSNAMEAALTTDKFRVRQIVPAVRNRTLANNRYEVDLSSPAALKQWHTSLAGGESNTIGAIINFLGLTETPARPGGLHDGAPLALAQGIFNVLKECETDLRQSARHGGGWLFNFTALGGKFGIDAAGPLPVAQAATIGMVKTVQREWPEVRVKSIDMDRSMDPQLLLWHIAEEIACDDGLLEVGIQGNTRWKIELRPEPPASDDDALPVDAQSVVLVTGGAYGVTAEAVKQLARAARPRFVLVGRSPLPDAESAEIAALPDVAAVRKHLIATMRSADPAVLPATIERAVQHVLKEREIRATLAELRRAGSAVEYQTVDVRDADRFGALLDDVYARHGRIDGVIHGAGVIDDGLIGKKTPESFAAVFATKVEGARVLADKLRGESLKFLVFFSSVTARFGNSGQIDYAAANEYLNKLAGHLAAQWPGRVVAINWGPWDAGMISDQLRRLYQSRGINLIPPQEGGRMFLAELKQKAGKAEVLLACNIPAMVAASQAGAR